jgi:predicted metal-dependent HD superfamily phosphohydrolase
MDQARLLRFEEAARADYRQPGRHYHNDKHLDDCLQLLETLGDLEARDRRVLRWSLIWHDSIYDPRRADNEERSALRANRELIAAEVDMGEVIDVTRLIRLTQGHEVERGDRLGAIIVSIDLAILGADPQTYSDYARSVRREYGHVDEAEWRAGRSEVLRKFLNAAVIYPDPHFRRLYESRARTNLERELAELSAS